MDDKLNLLGVRSTEAGPMPLKSASELYNDKLDMLECQMLSKAEILSGFAPEQGRVRHLFHVFRFHDKNNSGYINFPDFLDVLVKFCLFGIQKEAEDLFNRYDEDMIGHIDCREFARMLYRCGPYRSLTVSAKSVLYAMRAVLAGSYEYTGLRYCRAVMALPAVDGFVELGDMVERILPLTGAWIHRRAFILLLSEMDRKRDDMVSAGCFLKKLKVSSLSVCLRVFLVGLNPVPHMRECCNQHCARVMNHVLCFAPEPYTALR